MQEKETNNYLFALIGSNIRYLRTIAKLSQGELAEKMGISRQQLVNYETKEVATPLKQLNKLKQIFDTSIDALVYTDLSNGGTIDLSSNQKEKQTNLNKKRKIDIDSISSNDLSILNRKYYRNDPETVEKYLLYSEAHIKAKCSDLLLQIKESIDTLNKIRSIATTLKLDLDEYYSHRFALIVKEDYIKDTHEDLGLDSVNFENNKIKWIIKLLSFQSTIEHLYYLTGDSVNYLESGLRMYLDDECIKIDEELMKKLNPS